MPDNAGQNAIKNYYDGIGRSQRAWIVKSNVKIYSMPERENILRILPPLTAGEFFGLEVWIHSNVGINKDSFLCGRKSPLSTKFGFTQCVICDYIASIQRRGGAKEEYDPLRARRRVMFNMVDRDKPSDGVQIWVAPYTAADDIVRLCYDRRTQAIQDISDPVKGYDIFITREGQGINTKYKGIQLDRLPTPVEDRYLSERILMLDSLVIPKSEDIVTALGLHVTADPMISDTSIPVVNPPDTSDTSHINPEIVESVRESIRRRQER